MKISLNWLRDYIVDLKPDSIASLSDKMVSVGLDIEGIEDHGRIFDKFVVGEVIEKEKHPDADKLSLCKVNVGDKILSIVCGAANVEKGQKVCVALEKAIIPNGGFEIKRSKIRGQLSEGMICSEKELNMSDKHEGILVLEANAIVGEKFSEHIKANDYVFEIGITPNRGDLFSHIGTAREVAALYDKKISIPEIKISESNTPTSDLIDIQVESNELCNRFTGRIISNIEVKESPDWLKVRLKAIGLRPINNIVDVTNFVMFETGQPMHAFDYDKMRGKKIIVKTAKDGEKFITLDSKERVLSSDSLMVCDGEGYIGIAGIMGGENSEVTSATKNILLESAYFNPVSVRKTSKRLNLQTDASQRFERGVDIDNVKYSSLRAAQLIQEVAGGEISKELCDVYPEQFQKNEVGLRVLKANELIGMEINENDTIDILGKIEIKFLRKEEDRLIFEIPEFRRLDITREADLIEEVLRLYGYDNVQGVNSFTVSADASDIYKNTTVKFNSEITNYLIGRGFNQILTIPLTDANKIKDQTTGYVKLENTVSTEMNSMRTSLISGMMNVVRNNINNNGKDVSLKLFESGRVFSDNGKKFREEERIIICLSGKKDTELIYGGEKSFDIFDIKGEVEMLLYKLNLENFALIYYNDKDSTGRTIEISIDKELTGIIYIAPNSLLKEFDIENEVYLAEIYTDKLFRHSQKIIKSFSEIPKYPSVKRDLAVVVDKGVMYDKIEETVKKSGSGLLKNMKLFDIYEDDKIGESKKSIGITLEFSSNEKTLTDDATGKVMNRIIGSLEKNLEAKIRV
ncbi:MAG: phenylalanine--tRNA ligase subunit beta [bacterium]|nr:phenylalanine--tRNA ligase subunit beta [bacterium]